MPKVIVGIMMTTINAGGANMKTALSNLGWDFVVLGENTVWTGWATRMTEYANFASRQDPDDIVVLVDAYDAIATRSPLGFVELFESFGTDLVIGAENFCMGNCKPLDEWWVKKSVLNTFGNLYVQGGCTTGRAFAIEKLYRWCVDANIPDDQIAIANYLLEHDSTVASLDYGNKIAFHDNWGSTGHFSINAHNDDVVVKRGDLVTEPYFVHFPGFLVWRSIPILSLKPSVLANYDFVAKHVLKEQFIQIGQYDNGTFTCSNAVFLGAFIVLTIVVVLSIFLLTVLYKKINRHLLKTKSTQVLMAQEIHTI
jgi:hypothetical protein